MDYKSKITFYENCPITKINEIIYFDSVAQREAFFNNLNPFDFDTENFNHVRDRWSIRVPANNFSILKKYNYAKIEVLSENMSYYGFIKNLEYINDGVVRIDFLPDFLTTFFSIKGQTIAKNVMAIRQSLTHQEFLDNFDSISRNAAEVAVGQKFYCHQDIKAFKEFVLFIISSVNLGEEFGKVELPTMKTSSGNTYDKVTSPANLYMCYEEDSQEIFNLLQDYPWITRNFMSIYQIPADLVSFDNFGTVNGKTVDYGGKLYQPRKNTVSKTVDFPELDVSERKLNDVFDINSDFERILEKVEYSQIEMLNWQGQNVEIEPALLQEGTVRLTLSAQVTMGYDNNIDVFIKGYNSQGENQEEGLYAGSFLGMALNFSTWNNIPILIDNKALNMAEGMAMNPLNKALQTIDPLKNGVSSALGARTGNGIIDGALGAVNQGVSAITNLGSQVVDTVSGMPGVKTAMSIGGSLVNFGLEMYESYQQNPITPATITAATTTNSPAIKNDYFGVTLKFSKITKRDRAKVLQYHHLFGFNWNIKGDIVLGKMTICEFYQFNGSWNVDNVPAHYMEIIRSLFEAGVRFWHCNDPLKNPFEQDVLQNDFM